MKNNSLTLFLLFSLSVSLHAAETTTDTLSWDRQFALDELVVTGSCGEVDVRNLSQNVTVVERGQLEQQLNASVLPSLVENVPGLFLTQRSMMGYGVSGGAAGGISMRGLTGGSGQMMVLVDGHPQFMGLMGHPISDAYQMQMTERVEVLRGPASVLYGSNAMAGVINLVTRTMMEDGVQTDIHAGYGAYNTVETQVTNRVNMKGFTSVVSASYNRSDGHRERMNFQQYGGFAKLGYRFDEHWQVSADVDVTHYDASQPGTIDAPLFDCDQRITRGVAQVGVRNHYAITEGGISGYYNWGDHWINDGHSESADPLAYRYRSTDHVAGVSAYQSVRMFRGNRLTVGFDYTHLGGRAWNHFVAGPNVDTNTELANRTANEVAGYLDFRQNIMTFMTINAGLRADWRSDVGLEWIPQAGLTFHVPYDIELKLSAAKGYRNPTFKEMYMFKPKNDQLLPERLWTYEFSFSQSLLEQRLRYNLTAFFIDGKNMIMLVPHPELGHGVYENSGAIRHAGVEAEISGRVHDCVYLDANYSYLWMRDPVVSAPEHKLYGGVRYQQGRWSVSTGVQYVHGLYTALATKSAPAEQQNYVLWNARARVEICRYVGLWIRAENLLAQRYETVKGYPMPGATGMGGIDIHF